MIGFSAIHLCIVANIEDGILCGKMLKCQDSTVVKVNNEQVGVAELLKGVVLVSGGQ